MGKKNPVVVSLISALILQLQLTSCGGGGNSADPQVDGWPIDSNVVTTAERQVLPVAVSPDVPQINPKDITLYEKYGYTAWKWGPGLPYEKRTELAPGHTGEGNAFRLLSFFSMSDIHITDKESPAQANYIGWSAPYGKANSSAWSPVVNTTTQVLDAAIQTINVLHQKTPFDFGISLGDDANNTQYNELRWFIDVFDGGLITPSSGDHIGAETIDYQMPYQAQGLDKSIPWYAVIGNHDQFWMGSAYEDEKTLNAHISDTVLNMGYDPSAVLPPVDETGTYMGVVDGSDPYGAVIKSGPEGDFTIPPMVAPDASRHSLSTLQSTSRGWMNEFFQTSSGPVGHGFTQANLDNDFACYSFEPKAGIPIKIIVLDDTCKGPGQPQYARGCLDSRRLNWLRGELQEGQDNDKLMIIAAHIPIHPQQTLDPTSGNFPLFSSTSVVNDQQLLAILHNYPNLMLWMSGHRHVNVVTPQPSSDPASHPEQSFWEVETSSLRDFPQQFRTIDIRRNSDNTISIVVTNVDPSVAGGTPAETGRASAIGSARVFNGSPTVIADTTSHAYNAELVKQLTPKMQAKIANLGTAIE